MLPNFSCNEFPGDEPSPAVSSGPASSASILIAAASAAVCGTGGARGAAGAVGCARCGGRVGVAVGIAVGGRGRGIAVAVAVCVCTSGIGVCVATAAVGVCVAIVVTGASGCHCELVAVVLGASLCQLRCCRQQKELMTTCNQIDLPAW
jgi:hypothetical protein